MRFFGQSYLEIRLEPIRTQNLGSLIMKLSQSNFDLWLPDCYLARSYLIATVYGILELIMLVSTRKKKLTSYISTYFIYGFTSDEALLLKVHEYASFYR